MGFAFGSVVRCCSSFLVRAKVVLYYNDVYEVILPPSHRFPMNKYKLVREGYALQLSWSRHRRLHQIITSLRVRLQRDVKGFDDGVSVQFLVSPMSTKLELETTHCPLYIERFFMGMSSGHCLAYRFVAFSMGTPQILPLHFYSYLAGNLSINENRQIGFPWSEAGVRRSISSVGEERSWEPMSSASTATYCFRCCQNQEALLRRWGRFVVRRILSLVILRGVHTMLSEVLILFGLVMQPFPPAFCMLGLHKEYVGLGEEGIFRGTQNKDGSWSS